MSLVETASAAWAVRIAGAWRRSVEAVLEAGRLLKEAKARAAARCVHWR